jgi:hypothetical protein
MEGFEASAYMLATERVLDPQSIADSYVAPSSPDYNAVLGASARPTSASAASRASARGPNRAAAHVARAAEGTAAAATTFWPT